MCSLFLLCPPCPHCTCYRTSKDCVCVFLSLRPMIYTRFTCAYCTQVHAHITHAHINTYYTLHRTQQESSWGKGGQQPKNVEIGVLIKASSSAEVHGFVSRFPVHLSSDDNLDTSATERGYVMARGPSDGDSRQGADGGLQGRWRARCGDLSALPEWRGFLHGFWHICSRCGANGVRPGATEIRTMERNARDSVPFVCSDC